MTLFRHLKMHKFSNFINIINFITLQSTNVQFLRKTTWKFEWVFIKCTVQVLKFRNIDSSTSHTSTYTHEIKVFVTFDNNYNDKQQKNWYSLKLSLLIFTKIAEWDTCEIFCNHQIAKLNTRKMCFIFQFAELVTREI